MYSAASSQRPRCTALVGPFEALLFGSMRGSLVSRTSGSFRAGRFLGLAGQESGKGFDDQFSAAFWWGAVVGTDMSVALPCESDLVIRVRGFEFRVQPGGLFVRKGKFDQWVGFPDKGSLLARYLLSEG